MTNVHVGSVMYVPRDNLTRAGQAGTVLEVYEDGVTLDFFVCFCGDTRCSCYTSIEYWKFSELEPLA